MPNFNDIADKHVGETEKPPLIPIGHYRAMVKELPTIDKSNDEVYEFVTFKMQAYEPTDDVDPQELADFGDIRAVTRNLRFIFNTQDEQAFKRTEYNLRQFLERSLGLDCASQGYKQAMSQSVGARCLIQIKYRPDKNDPEIRYDEIGRTAPLE